MGLQHGFWNRCAVRRRLATGHELRSDLFPSRFRQFSTGGPRLFFHFLEAFIVARFFPVRREVGFVFLDFLFLHIAAHSIVNNFMRQIASNFLRNFVRIVVRNVGYNGECDLRNGHEAGVARLFLRGCLRRRVSLLLRVGLLCGWRLVPGFRNFRHQAHSGATVLISNSNVRVHHMLLRFGKRLGSLCREDWLIPGKVSGN